MLWQKHCISVYYSFSHHLFTHSFLFSNFQRLLLIFFKARDFIFYFFQEQLKQLREIFHILPPTPQPSHVHLCSVPRLCALTVGCAPYTLTSPSIHLCTALQSPFLLRTLLQQFSLMSFESSILHQITLIYKLVCNFPHPQKTSIKSNKNNLLVIPHPSPARGSFICSLLHQNSLKELHCLKFLPFFP